MSVLTAADRRQIPTSQYGLPGERKYPMPDHEHAIIAKSYAAKELHAGRLSPQQYQQIVQHANRVLGAAHVQAMATALSK